MALAALTGDWLNPGPALLVWAGSVHAAEDWDTSVTGSLAGRATWSVPEPVLFGELSKESRPLLACESPCTCPGSSHAPEPHAPEQQVLVNLELRGDSSGVSVTHRNGIWAKWWAEWLQGNKFLNLTETAWVWLRDTGCLSNREVKAAINYQIELLAFYDMVSAR